jgi:chemotaxis protein MotB
VTRRRVASKPNHERWMISYADFITLLFALFVVMFAIAQSDHAKAKDLAASVSRALMGGEPPPQGNLPRAYQQLNRELAEELAAGKVTVTMDARGLVITLRDKAFFNSGGDEIIASAFGSMSKIAEVIKKLPNPVRLEGHTDSVPIHNGRFASNWDLSAARSIAVLKWFESRYGIPGERFAVAGYADNQPVAENDSEDGRAKNRRVSIVLLNQ